MVQRRYSPITHASEPEKTVPTYAGSAVLLAGANHAFNPEVDLPEEAEDGLLTAADVGGLDLLDTELVVLSACETAVGEVRIGEGVFGLRHAFLVAGAKTLVMSLWPVDDLATCILITRFYENLFRRRLPRDRALRAAKDYVRHLTVAYHNPYYWGAFILVG